jgi:hypothetical protein
MRVSTSQSVHSLFTVADLVLEKQIRDLFFGHNRVKQDNTRALEPAAACEHKDAQWLTRMFTGKAVTTTDEARDIFLALLAWRERRSWPLFCCSVL